MTRIEGKKESKVRKSKGSSKNKNKEEKKKT
jgi:hypothetical protein